MKHANHLIAKFSLFGVQVCQSVSGLRTIPASMLMQVLQKDLLIKCLQEPIVRNDYDENNNQRYAV